ncbi:SanA/YdcF family protein [Rhizocola hellebori]|nr:ElyC/SanA/YdcF family protein [Rhizocola hellebori]
MSAVAPPVGGNGRRVWWRRLRRTTAAMILVLVATVAASLIWVRAASAGRIYTLDDVPARPVALVLGAQVFADGTPSPFLQARLAMARDLYRAGKVRAVLVSGDNMNFGYNEPDAMRAWLIAEGVPSAKVVADYAGFDTSDSCQRAHRIFGATSLIVLTQSFHVRRAVALCRDAGIDAIGVGDDSVAVYRASWKRALVREQGATVKALIDVVTGQDPTHWGPRETSLDEAVRSEIK